MLLELLLSELLDIGDDFVVLLGLSMLTFSCVSGVEGAGQVPEGSSMSTVLTLGIGEGLLRADRCCSGCSTHGREVLAEGLRANLQVRGCDGGTELLGKVLFGS